MKRPRLVIGIVLWVAMAVLAGQALLAPEGVAREPVGRVIAFATESPRRLEVRFPAATDVRIGDPVLREDAATYLLQVGRVTRIVETPDGTIASIVIHPDQDDLLREGVRVEVFSVPSSAAWIAKTLVSSEHALRIRTMAEEFLAEHGESIREILWPEVQQGIRDVVQHIERELPLALMRQSPRWEAFFVRHRDGVVREALLPVLEKVTLALAREKYTPLLETVGKELWGALPVASLGWRAVWQKVPFAGEDQVRKRFERYLKEDAAPILARHADEAGRLAGEVVRESLKDLRVKLAIVRILRTVSADPELGEMTEELIDRLLLQNKRLGAIVRRRWEGGLRDAVSEAAIRFEPLIRQVVDSVVLDESRRGISPRLSRVLRTRVLMKDGRWIMISGGDGAPLPDGARAEGAIRHE